MINSSVTEELEKNGCVVSPFSGTSMLPLLRENSDMVVLESIGVRRLQKYDAVLYRRGEKLILHRIVGVRDQGYVICGDHQWRREFGVTEEQIFGIMTAVIREGREITDLKYKLYVRLWCGLFFIRAPVLFFAACVRRVLLCR